ncbi:MAG: sigma-70 family RNA polymerase sigma factor [Prevotellaceae bacterium]|jgi:RNA polymerase sigma-70 factor (ECF subfamily)|nr:sigma-70 family RNA polymerase sigma factor [Prevotellaceae bacterium]
MIETQYLVEGCINKDINAQRKLYERYAAKMLSVCLRYMNNEDEARDVMHDGFVKLFDKIKKFDGTGSLDGWIRKVFVNMCLEKLRISKKITKQNVYEADVLQIVDDSMSDVYQQLEAKELMRFVAELPASFRSVFNLYAIEGYSHDEIAKMLGIEQSSVRSAYSKAKNLLQKKIKLMYKEI